MRWFISDTHLGDETLLKRRYSKSVDQMDSHLASRWDAEVGAEDEVWVLGDVARGRTQQYVVDWFEARPGTKHLILGNWDEGTDYHEPFTTVQISRLLALSNGYTVALSHYSYGHRKNPEVPLTLVHGHTHSPKRVRKSPGGHLMLHVGWDAWRRMVAEDDLVELIEKEQSDVGVHDLRGAESP